MPIHIHDADQIAELEAAVASRVEHDEKSKMHAECRNASDDEIAELMRKHDLESYLAAGGVKVFRESFHRVKVRKPRGA